jgi:hypothetical protein
METSLKGKTPLHEEFYVTEMEPELDEFANEDDGIQDLLSRLADLFSTVEQASSEITLLLEHSENAVLDAIFHQFCELYSLIYQLERIVRSYSAAADRNATRLKIFNLESDIREKLKPRASTHLDPTLVEWTDECKRCLSEMIDEIQREVKSFQDADIDMIDSVVEDADNGWEVLEERESVQDEVKSLPETLDGGEFDTDDSPIHEKLKWLQKQLEIHLSWLKGRDPELRA